MFKFAKYVTVLSASVLFGCATIAGNTDKDGQFESEDALWQAAADYEAVLPILASWGDYRSASQVALGLAFVRNRLEGTTPAVCAALEDSREYQQFASLVAEEHGRADYDVLSGIQARTGGMARERTRCDRMQALAVSTARAAKTF